MNSRPAGGEHEQLSSDTGSVTGTGRTGTFVGQIAGDDLGYAEQTGAEQRRTHSRSSHEPRSARE